jgi:hypothetical protein
VAQAYVFFFSFPFIFFTVKEESSSIPCLSEINVENRNVFFKYEANSK